MDWGIEVLQTSALPLGYGAIALGRTGIMLPGRGFESIVLVERKTRFELATFTLAR